MLKHLGEMWPSLLNEGAGALTIVEGRRQTDCLSTLDRKALFEGQIGAVCHLATNCCQGRGRFQRQLRRVLSSRLAGVMHNLVDDAELERLRSRNDRLCRYISSVNLIGDCRGPLGRLLLRLALPGPAAPVML